MNEKRQMQKRIHDSPTYIEDLDSWTEAPGTPLFEIGRCFSQSDDDFRGLDDDFSGRIELGAALLYLCKVPKLFASYQEDDASNSFERLEVESPLSPLESEIEQSRKMLELEEDWDDNGAHPISKETWERATGLLRRMMISCNHATGCAAPVPIISACADGTIDIYWDTDSFRLLINVVPVALGNCEYYGESKSGQTMKGKFSPEKHPLLALEAFMRGL